MASRSCSLKELLWWLRAEARWTSSSHCTLGPMVTVTWVCSNRKFPALFKILSLSGNDRSLGFYICSYHRVWGLRRKRPSCWGPLSGFLCCLLRLPQGWTVSCLQCPGNPLDPWTWFWIGEGPIAACSQASGHEGVRAWKPGAHSTTLCVVGDSSLGRIGLVTRIILCIIFLLFLGA